jgi:membrane-associated phospholipid phosphatase
MARASIRSIARTFRGVGAWIAALWMIAGLHGAARAGEAEATGGHRLRWTYPRFRPAEYVATTLVMVAGFSLEYGTRGIPDNRLREGILLDDLTREVMVGRTEATRRSAGRASDLLWPLTQYASVVDALVTPLVTDRWNVDVAMQMTLINWQVQGVAFLLTRATHRTIGRTRPSHTECERDPQWDSSCVELWSHRASFLSGHVSMAFAGASAGCAHHIALPLYGGNALDAGFCAASLTAATAIGVLRVVADRHWWSDVVAGAALGTATGFGLPFVLHYAHPLSATAPLLGEIHVLPIAGPDAAGVSLVALR